MKYNSKNTSVNPFNIKFLQNYMSFHELFITGYGNI